MSSSILSMPSRNHSSAPKFDGKDSNLPFFLDEIEQLAHHCSLHPHQTIQLSLRYCPTEVYELWSGLDTATGNDWKAFKDELYTYYPGAIRKYSVASLELLVDKQSLSSIRSADQLGEYLRSFCTVSLYLKSKNKLTDREVSFLFLQGFDFAFRSQVRVQLRAENPGHNPDDPYTLQQISDAALSCLLSNNEHSS